MSSALGLEARVWRGVAPFRFGARSSGMPFDWRPFTISSEPPSVALRITDRRLGSDARSAAPPFPM